MRSLPPCRRASRGAAGQRRGRRGPAVAGTSCVLLVVLFLAFLVALPLPLPAQVPDGPQGRVVGRVTGTATGAPIEGVLVSAAGTAARAVTDGEGRFALTLPAGRHRLGFRHLAYARRTVETEVTEGATVRLQVHLPPAVLQIAPLRVTVEGELWGGPGEEEAPEHWTGVAGRVVDAESGDRVEGALVRVKGLEYRAITDGGGRFRFQLPPGRFGLEVRHIAYGTRTAELEVGPRRRAEVELRVPPRALEMEPLEVVVRSEYRVPYLEREDFYYRRKLGFGAFFGPQYISRWPGLRVPTLIARASGLRIIRAPGERYRVLNARCGYGAMKFVVDGQEWDYSPPTFPASEIAAVEIYKGPAQTFGTGHPSDECGLILVWTWRGPNPFIGSRGMWGCLDRVALEEC